MTGRSSCPTEALRLLSCLLALRSLIRTFVPNLRSSRRPPDYACESCIHDACVGDLVSACSCFHVLLACHAGSCLSGSRFAAARSCCVPGQNRFAGVWSCLLPCPHVHLALRHGPGPRIAASPLHPCHLGVLARCYACSPPAAQASDARALLLTNFGVDVHVDEVAAALARLLQRCPALLGGPL